MRAVPCREGYLLLAISPSLHLECSVVPSLARASLARSTLGGLGVV